MVQVDEKERIRNAYHIQEKSIRQIANDYHHSRKTVRKALANANPPVYTRVHPVVSPVMDSVKQIVDNWIQEDAQRPRKQRHTAHRVYERLRDEHGFVGSESSVRKYVSTRKERKKEPFVPLCFELGRDAQVDFGESLVIMDGQKTTVQVFHMQLCCSHNRFVVAFPFQKQEAFLEAHVRAFDFFAGVPRRITYDNLTSATYRALRGQARRELDSFIAFRSHYLFESHFCNPSQPHEKGQIENLVGYARRNWFVPVPVVKDFAELNAYLIEKCRQDEKRIVHGMKASIGEMFTEEKERLRPLPSRPFECFRLHPVRSNRMSIVCFETNSYSVPNEYASTELFLKAYFDRVEICDVRRVVAVHKRLLGKQQESLVPSHYLDALKMKPGAIEHARPIKNSEFAGAYFRFLEKLKEGMSESCARKAFMKVLELSAIYPEADLAQAMELALLYGSCDVDAVKNLLVQMNRDTVVPDSAPVPQSVCDVQVDVRDVGIFDRLLGRSA